MLYYEEGALIDVKDEGVILVVMSSHSGVRYIDPNNLEFDDQGNIKTTYIRNEVLWDKQQIIGHVNSAILSQ